MRRNRKRVRAHINGFFRNILLLGFVGGFFLAGAFLLWASTLKIPDLDSLYQRKVAQSTKIYDRTGEILLFNVHEDIRRTIVPLSDISRNIENATIAIEDVEFYEHRGIKPQAILRALFVNIGELNFSQGGSTITQQVVKNSILTKEKKLSRKLKEWVLALKVEQQLTKEQILELYLNETPYGGSVYGVEEASKTFFGKSSSDVTLAEAAFLAALPKAPTFYSPYGNNRDELEERKNLVLERMFNNGFISRGEYEFAQKEQIEFQGQAVLGIRAPHFVMFVREYLSRTYGDRAIEERGFRVITTLDYELQEKGEEIVARFVETNVENFNASNAGLVAVDPKTGQILVMVGSRNYFDEEIDGNFNITLAERQPGSAFKPFVYATALFKGYTTETVVFDTQTQFSTLCDFDDLENENTECYSPRNYDNIFRGPVTFRDALAQSINVPSVKVLYLAGIQDSIKTASSMGITTLSDAGRYGLTLVLGGGEVTLLDMTSAYGVFANEGKRNPYVGILRIEDSDGVVVEEFSHNPIKVISEEVALRISDILSDNKARTPAFGSRSDLYFPGYDVAVKTGTTNDSRDAWIIGYSPTIAVGAWAGNNDNSPMEKKVAGFIIAPLWNAFMQEILVKVPNERFRSAPQEYNENIKPVLRGVWEGGDLYFIDDRTGSPATENTPMENMKEIIVKNVHSILYWVDKNDPRGEKPDSPEDSSQFNAWEYGVFEWKKTNGIVDDVLPY
ncbi:penicillin-binding protein [Patescibacteria group bacterium]|nr:penicillin-binding protein [Patescibacteria group bacterium]